MARAQDFQGGDPIVEARRAFFEAGRTPVGQVPGAILQSWRRCRGLGLAANARPAIEPIDAPRLRAMREQHERLWRLARAEVEMLAADAANTGSIAILTDAEGWILDAEGSAAFLDKAGRVALMPGACWSEARVGTNAIGTAIAEGRAVEVRGGEHYAAPHRILNCAASPIFDPYGRMVGVLDISGDASVAQVHALGLSQLAVAHIEHRYFDEGSGRPKETEPGHFKLEIGKYAKQKNLSAEEYEQRYDAGEIVEPELDRYFVHDRAMRESGHDTTARLDDLCADLACVDLNAVLYDVELKISALIDDYFPQGLRHNGREYSGSEWYEKAQVRYDLVQEYLWNEEAGCFYDYNVRRGQAQIFDSATNLYPLWAGLCEPEQAEKLVRGQLPKLMCAGGISATAPLPPHIHGPERQWDYPYGWAPHQILLWEGLQRYGYHQEMHDAAYAWVQMIIRATVEYNGLIPEKFDVVKGSHKTDVEYGNVGTVFEYLPAGGFGWTNASLILGIAKLTEVQKAQLNGLAQTVD